MRVSGVTKASTGRMWLALGKKGLLSMIKDKAALISFAPWLTLSAGFAIFGPEEHPIAKMGLFVIMLIGLFYAIILLMKKYKKYCASAYLGGVAVIGSLYSIFAWRVGLSSMYIVVTALLALFSYILFIFLVQKPQT